MNRTITWKKHTKLIYLNPVPTKSTGKAASWHKANFPPAARHAPSCCQVPTVPHLESMMPPNSEPQASCIRKSSGVEILPNPKLITSKPLSCSPFRCLKGLGEKSSKLTRIHRLPSVAIVKSRQKQGKSSKGANLSTS